MPAQISARSEIIPKLGEIFREYGYAGTSLSEITTKTNLGKSSLYHFFPNGKAEMAEAVLDEIDTWFTQNIFTPLRKSKDTSTSIQVMFKAVDEYFQSGNRICLIGAFALDNTRDQFLQIVSSYFKEWITALAVALKRAGYSSLEAKALAEEIVIGIQGALVLARSQNDPKTFTRALKRLKNRLI